MVSLSGAIAILATVSDSPLEGSLRQSFAESAPSDPWNKNVTCDDYDNPDLIRVCHEQPTMKSDCFIWNCSICFWGNDSCYNFDVGPRTDCPTAICVLEPRPVPVGPNKAFIVYPIIGVLCLILVGVLLYLVKLLRENRAYRRARENNVQRFLNARESLQQARRDNERSQRIIEELAAAANVPVPSNDPPPLNELEQLANEPVLQEQPSASHTTEETRPRSASGSHARPPLRRIRQAGRDLNTNFRNMYGSARQRLHTRFQLVRQSIRHPQFSRLRESAAE